ncbi:MAG: hypothetical protein IMX02_02800 [Limnochordaceae bacterium]|nr:hypothetical protein [Limnochordaceae bacterium]
MREWAREYGRGAGFTGWLRRQWRRDDPVGDLARDVRLDPDWPGRARRPQTYRRYLEQCGACEGALRALERAWVEWRLEEVPRDAR